MPAPVQLDPADLTALAALVKTAGFKQVAYEASEVKVLPGVWIRVDQIDVLAAIQDGCVRLATTMHIIVGSKPVDRALAELLPLLDQLVEVVTPSGPISVVGVDTGLKTPLPALAVPVETRTTPTA